VSKCSLRNLLYVRRPRSFKDCRATGKKKNLASGERIIMYCGELDSYGSKYGPVAGCWENGNEPSGSIKGGQVLDQLSNV
jgi:hypothetical protein